MNISPYLCIITLGFDCSTDDKYNSELPNIIKVINEEPLIEIPPVE